MAERSPIKKEHVGIIRDIINATNDMTRIKDGKNYTGGHHGYYVLMEHFFFRISIDHGDGTAKRIFKEVMENAES